uniref:Uncharacterized protein n=1 Tax=Timema cristinae TaxID=61476 RepID=A0A7R9GRN8_TIMCR|nr:unnamed protein product [Timema cristinae]
MAAFVLYRSEFLATDPEVPEESEEDCDDLVAAVALKRKKTPSQYASILSHTLKAEIDIVKYAVINVDVSDNVPIQPVTSINIREKEIEDIVQRMPSDSQLAEKKYAVINVDVSDNVPIQPVTSINIREKEIEDIVQRMPSDSQIAEKANAQQEQLNKLNEVIDQIKKEKDCPTEVFLNITVPGCNVVVVIPPYPFQFGRLRHSCPAQFADIVRGLATTGARRVGTPMALARWFVCGTSRRQNADPWSPDAASTASPKAAISRITCVSQNRTATIIRTRTQYGSWRYGCSSARLRDFQTRGLGVRSSGSTVPYTRGTRSSVWKTKYFPATYSPSLVQRSVDKKPTNAFRVSGSATKGRSNIDTMPPLTPSHAD